MATSLATRRSCQALRQATQGLPAPPAMRAAPRHGSCCPAALPRPATAVAVAVTPSRASGGVAVRAAASKAAAAAPSTVKIIIQGRRLEVTDAIRQHILDKVSKAASKYKHGIREIDVTISARGGDTGTKGTKEQRVDVTLHTIRSGVVRVEYGDPTSLYAAVDLVCDKVERKMQKVKEKAIAAGKWPGHAGGRSDGSDAVAELREMEAEVLFNAQVMAAEDAMAELGGGAGGAGGRGGAKLPEQLMRRKTVLLDPMTVEEAMDAMEAVGHDFFVFREMTSDTLQVVYKREAGGYGLLLPQKRD